MRRAISWLTVVAMGLGLLIGALSFSARSATASTCNPYPSGCTPPADPSDPMSMVTHLPTGAAAVPVTGPSSLASTGADVAHTVVLGLILVGLGVVLVGTAQRHPAV